MRTSYALRRDLLVLILGVFAAIAGPVWAGATPTPGCTNDTWTATSTTNAPAGRYNHTAVWTGSEMIVWGGNDGTSNVNTGGTYNPSTDTWGPTSTVGAPDGRFYHTAVWTGTEMIVWGGSGGSNSLNTGGRYNPSTDTWTPTSTTNAPTARGDHTAVWTGTEMIVWGGTSGDSTGGRYNPATDTWTPTSTTNAPTARGAHTAIWTGAPRNEMIVWGGVGSAATNTGGTYNPTTDSWTVTSVNNAPDARYSHTAIWTGTEMIVWGGYVNISTGGRYNPETDTWTATGGVCCGRYFHRAVWTGSEMVVWGGLCANCGPPILGLRYDPLTDSWITVGGPDVLYYHTAVWTGSEVIVWGGRGCNGNCILNTGVRYCVQPQVTSTPTPPPTPTPPTLSISGTVGQCTTAGPSGIGLANTTMTLSSGFVAISMLTDGSGNYSFTLGGPVASCTVTPTKAARAPASSGINTTDVIAIQRHFLGLGTPLSGCRLAAADCAGSVGVNTQDVIACQRFFLGFTTGIGDVGNYQFSPVSISYTPLTTTQTAQDYAALIFGDVAVPFVE